MIKFLLSLFFGLSLVAIILIFIMGIAFILYLKDVFTETEKQEQEIQDAEVKVEAEYTANTETIKQRLREHYQYLLDNHYEVVLLALQGSQNYGLDEYSKDYQSDVDSKAIILPNFKDYVYNNQPISTTIVLDNNEHIDIKDIRVAMAVIKKMNISYIELLFSDYVIINPKYEKIIKVLFEKREEIARAHQNQFVRCLAGMSMEKRKALCHPYPNLIEKIEKYGYDGKQLSHCARLNEFIIKYMSGIPVKDCYKATDKEKIMNYKKQLVPNGTQIMTQKDAIAACAYYDDNTKYMKELFINSHNEYKDEKIYQLLDDVQYQLLKKKFKEDII